MKERILRDMKRLRPLDWALRFFWLTMLVSHLPLTLRSFLRLSGEGQTLHNYASFLTLVFSCLFFAYKLFGFRMIAKRPTWRRAVVYFVLGAMVHLLIFCPSLPLDRFELLAELTGSAIFTLVLIKMLAVLAALAGVAVSLIARSASRAALQDWVFFENSRPSLISYLSVLPHRGPPRTVSVY